MEVELFTELISHVAPVWEAAPTVHEAPARLNMLPDGHEVEKPLPVTAVEFAATLAVPVAIGVRPQYPQLFGNGLIS